jgi:hypothetical protein
LALPRLFGGERGVKFVGRVVVLEGHVVASLPLVKLAQQVARRSLAHAISRLLKTFQRALQMHERLAGLASVQESAALLALSDRAAGGLRGL